MAKYFLMPGFDRPHSQGILLFSRDGNKLVTNPPVKNLGWVFVWVCMCAPTHAQGPESRRQVRSLALKRTTESTESHPLAVQASQEMSARGTEERSCISSRSRSQAAGLQGCDYADSFLSPIHLQSHPVKSCFEMQSEEASSLGLAADDAAWGTECRRALERWRILPGASWRKHSEKNPRRACKG